MIVSLLPQNQIHVRRRRHHSQMWIRLWLLGETAASRPVFRKIGIRTAGPPSVPERICR